MNEIDTAVFLIINASDTSPAWLLSLARTASLELPKVLLAGMAGAALFMDPRRRHALLAVLAAMLAAWISARLIQYAIPVQRPFALGLGTVWLERAPTAGFPSTHASVAFAFAFAVCLRIGWTMLSGLALSLAAWVAWSRVCLGLHFPSDVLAGAAVGALCAWACWRRPTWRNVPWRRATGLPDTGTRRA